MARQVLIALILAVAVSYFVRAEEEQAGPKASVWERMPLASDVEWNELSGALTIEELERLQFRQDKKERRSLWGMVEGASHTRNVKCMKAFGHARFCRCLGERLPVLLTFDGYVTIATGMTTELNLPDMNAEEAQRLVNTTIEARERCVADAIHAH